MYNNILKGGYVVDRKEKVVIDNNMAVEKILEEMAQQMQAEENPAEFEEEFVEGIDAEQVAQLVADEAEVDRSKLKEEQAKWREEAEAEIEQMRQQALEEIESMRAQASEQGYQDGFSSGQQKAEEECRARYQAREQELTQKEKELQEKYQAQLDELEPALVEKLTGIYEHVLGIRIEEEKENVLFLLHRAFAAMDSGRNYIIHISKEEYDAVKAAKEEISIETGMPEDSFEIIADGMMKKGDCLIESDLGIMDCGMGTQMEMLKRQLKILSYNYGE